MRGGEGNGENGKREIGWGMGRVKAGDNRHGRGNGEKGTKLFVLFVSGIPLCSSTA